MHQRRASTANEAIHLTMILLSILFKQCASDLVYRLVKSRSLSLGSRVMVSLNRLISICLDHLNSSFLVFIDNYFNGPAWCVTPIRLFICYGTTLRYLTLKSLGFSLGRGIASADFVKFQNKKSWSLFSMTIRINKGGDCEFLAIAV